MGFSLKQIKDLIRNDQKRVDFFSAIKAALAKSKTQPPTISQHNNTYQSTSLEQHLKMQREKILKKFEVQRVKALQSGNLMQHIDAQFKQRNFQYESIKLDNAKK